MSIFIYYLFVFVICMFECMFIYMHTLLYIYVYSNVYMYTYMYNCMYISGTVSDLFNVLLTHNAQTHAAVLLLVRRRSYER